jgi:protein RecA
LKAVELAVGQIEKQFGKGSIMRLGQKGAIQPIDFISTGSISIDYALGVGGVPRGRVVEIFGPESSGKTTLALQIIAEAQKLGGMAAFVDAEHALDAAYALRRRRRRCRGLGGRARAEGGNRRRDGRCADGPAGPADVPGSP